MLFADETVHLSYLMCPHIIMSTDRYVQDHYALGLLCPWQLYPRTAMFTDSYFNRPLCSRTYDCVHRHALFTDRCVNGALCSRTDVSMDSYCPRTVMFTDQCVNGQLCLRTTVPTDRYVHGPMCPRTAFLTDPCVKGQLFTRIAMSTMSTDRYVHKPLCLRNAVSM